MCVTGWAFPLKLETIIKKGFYETNDFNKNLSLENAIKKASAKDSASMDEVNYEGYGPFGVPMVIELETDNKNRTLGEIKLIFRKMF